MPCQKTGKNGLFGSFLGFYDYLLGALCLINNHKYLAVKVNMPVSLRTQIAQ